MEIVRKHINFSFDSICKSLMLKFPIIIKSSPLCNFLIGIGFFYN